MSELNLNERPVMITRALAMGGINVNPPTCELILGIIEEVDKKGGAITMDDVTAVAMAVDNKYKAQQKPKATPEELLAAAETPPSPPAPGQAEMTVKKTEEENNG